MLSYTHRKVAFDLDWTVLSVLENRLRPQRPQTSNFVPVSLPQTSTPVAIEQRGGARFAVLSTRVHSEGQGRVRSRRHCGQRGWMHTRLCQRSQY